MELKNIKKWLDKFAGLYNDTLKRTVDVKTGALKRSITTRVDGFSMVTSMLGYGADRPPWSDEVTPIERLSSLYDEKSKGLQDAFMQDLKIDIKNNTKKYKNIKYVS